MPKKIRDQHGQRKTHDTISHRKLTLDVSKGGPASYDAETRSVNVVGATEQPVMVYDYERMEVVNEVLLMAGAELPKNRQVPLLNNHQRHGGAGSILGSYRELQVSGDQLEGRAYFSTIPVADDPAKLVEEGHLTDFSVGYRIIKKVWIDSGESKKVRGKSFEGPISVVTRWAIKELSAVPIGADDKAKARAEADKTQSNKLKKGVKAMNKKLFDLLVKRGLAEDATEEQAQAFLADLLEKRELILTSDLVVSETAPAGESVDVDKAVAQGIREYQERIREIQAMCDQAGAPEMSRDLISLSIDEARAKVMEHLIERNKEAAPPTGFAPATITADAQDKFQDAGRDAILMRAGNTLESPSDGADELMGYSLVEMARLALQMERQRTSGRPMDIVGRAFQTGHFTNILANVANKALLDGWEQAEETWQDWCGTGSVSDFKTHDISRLSAADDLDEVKENAPYDYGEMEDAKEQYQIATYGKLFAISRQAIINDDLGAFTQIPFLKGEAAKRKVGDVAYAVLTANAAMGDGAALFVAAHANLQASGSPPGITSVGAGIKAMKIQTDVSGKATLNIRPRFFIAPATLEGVAEVFFRSEKFADSDTVATDSSLAASRVNPYAGSYFSRVYDPRLDANSTTAWYLAGPKGKTVTVFFLDGVQTPYMEQKAGWTVDGTEFKVRIDAGAKAVDWVGLYKDPGA